MAVFHILSMVLKHHTVSPGSICCCFLIIALQYSLLVELPSGIDGKLILGLHPVSSSNGEGILAVSEVHLYSMRLKFQGFSCREE